MQVSESITTAAVYGQWVKRSIKAPILFAAGTAFLSNIFYMLSYNHGGFWLLAAARFMSGLGTSQTFICTFLNTAERLQAYQARAS